MPICPPRTSHTHDVGSTRFTAIAAPSTGAREASVWRVEIPAGTEALPHELTREELIVVLSGTARASVGDDIDEVGPGGAIVVPPDTPFSLTAVGPDPLVALAFLPVGGQARMPGGEPFTPPWTR